MSFNPSWFKLTTHYSPLTQNENYNVSVIALITHLSAVASAKEDNSLLI